jgi:hypothetical protein
LRLGRRQDSHQIDTSADWEHPIRHSCVNCRIPSPSARPCGEHLAPPHAKRAHRAVFWRNWPILRRKCSGCWTEAFEIATSVDEIRTGSACPD